MPPRPQPATQTLPQYSTPAETRSLPMSPPPQAILLPQSPQHNASPRTRAIQPIVPPGPIEPLPPATPDTDIDPFEHEPYVPEEHHESELHPATPYSLSPEMETSVHTDLEEDDQDANEESQLFPGSGLF
jgi:hypothetical protein